MSKFKPMELIDKMSGKFHSKSKYYAAEKYGTQYTGLVGEITVPPTEKQVTNRDKFTTAHFVEFVLKNEGYNPSTKVEAEVSTDVVVNIYGDDEAE